MPLATRIRLFSSFLLPLLFGLVVLLSGCQSSRPGFAFQPAPHWPQQTEIAVAVAATPDSATAAVPILAARIASPVSQAQHAARRQAAARHIAALSKAVLIPKISHPMGPQRRALLQRPHATAESGLGTTVLGVLGLIALPIAAVGLILSGGALGWIIVGGLAALAVLVAYIDPFGR